MPEGKVLADANEYAVLKQNNERVRGMQPYWEAGSKYGIKKPEDFESVGKWRKFEDTLKAKGMTTDQIIAAFDAPTQEESGAGLDLATIEKQLGQKFMPVDKFHEELARRDALSEHKNMTAREKELFNKHLNELLGENPSSKDKFLTQYALRGLIEDFEREQPFRRAYDDKHPLRNEYLAPLDEKGLAAVIDEFKKNIAESDGADMAKLGKAAAQSKPTAAPAGNRASQGKAEDDKNDSPKAQLRSAVERAMSGRG